MWCVLISGSIGFVAGWIVFKRPEWATRAVTWIKGKLGWA